MSLKSSKLQGIATSIAGVREDKLGIVFRTEPHPDRQDFMLVCYDAIENLSLNWDGSSDVEMHFNNTDDRLLVSAELVRTALLLAKSENFGK